MLIRTDFTPLATRFTGINGLHYAGYRPTRPAAESNSFAAVLDSQYEQSKTQETSHDGIPVITPGPGIYHAYSEELARGPNLNFNNYTPEEKIQILLGWEQNLKYFDFSSGISLEQVMDAAKNADYTGMSDAEIFMEIFNRYAEAFGDNFNMAPVSYLTAGPDVFTRIRSAFSKELVAAFGESPNRITQAFRVATYGNMSESDITAEILAKYPPGNQMTLREYHQLVIELSDVGIGGNLGLMLSRLIDCDFEREGLLDQRMDLSRICKTYNSMYMRGSVSIQTGLFLQDLFGISLDGKGFASPPLGMDYPNWDDLIKQWMTKTLQWSEDEYEKHFFPNQQLQ